MSIFHQPLAQNTKQQRHRKHQRGVVYYTFINAPIGGHRGATDRNPSNAKTYNFYKNSTSCVNHAGALGPCARLYQGHCIVRVHASLLRLSVPLMSLSLNLHVSYHSRTAHHRASSAAQSFQPGIIVTARHLGNSSCN